MSTTPSLAPAAASGSMPTAEGLQGQKTNMPKATFMPADYVARKGEQRANLLSLALFGVVMLGVVGAFGVTNRAWVSVREERTKVDELYAAEAEKIEQLKQLEQQRAQMMEKAEVTAALVENVPRSVLLGELVLRLPKDVKLTGLDLKSKRIEAIAAPPTTAAPPPKQVVRSLADTAKKTEPAKPRVVAPRFEYTMTLTGVAGNNNDIADYIAGLRDCALLKDVELSFIKETKILDRELRQFEVQAKIRPEADGRALAASLTERLQEAGGIESKTGGVSARPKSAGASSAGEGGN
jgi:Tfp pilus assembly protein PilN